MSLIAYQNVTANVTKNLSANVTNFVTKCHQIYPHFFIDLNKKIPIKIIIPKLVL